jgi:hypothetical protein
VKDLLEKLFSRLGKALGWAAEKPKGDYVTPKDPCAWGHSFQPLLGVGGLPYALYCRRCGKTQFLEDEEPTEEIVAIDDLTPDPPLQTALRELRREPWVKFVEALPDPDDDDHKLVIVITRSPGHHVPTEGLIRMMLDKHLGEESDYRIHVQWPVEDPRR